MRYVKIILSCMLVVMLCSAAVAYDFQRGIQGMKWGSSIADNAGLSKVHEAERVVYYFRPDTLYQISDEPVAGVFYGFYKDKFFAVFVKMHTPHQFSELKKAFDAKYGAAKSTFNSLSKQQVYRWKDGDVKIKLKMIEATGQFKLAFYYAPLATKLNEERLENIPPELYKLTVSKQSQSVKSVPLLDE